MNSRANHRKLVQRNNTDGISTCRNILKFQKDFNFHQPVRPNALPRTGQTTVRQHPDRSCARTEAIMSKTAQSLAQKNPHHSGRRTNRQSDHTNHPAPATDRQTNPRRQNRRNFQAPQRISTDKKAGKDSFSYPFNCSFIVFIVSLRPIRNNIMSNIIKFIIKFIQ